MSETFTAHVVPTDAEIHTAGLRAVAALSAAYDAVAETAHLAARREAPGVSVDLAPVGSVGSVAALAPYAGARVTGAVAQAHASHGAHGPLIAADAITREVSGMALLLAQRLVAATR